MSLHDCSKCGGRPQRRSTNDRSGIEYRCGGCGKNGGRKNAASGARLSWNAANPQTSTKIPFIALVGDEFRVKGKPATYKLTSMRHDGPKKVNFYDLEGWGDVTQRDLIHEFVRVLPKEAVPAPVGYGAW